MPLDGRREFFFKSGLKLSLGVILFVSVMIFLRGGFDAFRSIWSTLEMPLVATLVLSLVSALELRSLMSLDYNYDGFTDRGKRISKYLSPLISSVFLALVLFYSTFKIPHLYRELGYLFAGMGVAATAMALYSFALSIKIFRK